MERCSQLDFERLSLKNEHRDRYKIASLVATGRVVDCACGIGYGSEILKATGKVSHYHGIDLSESVIEKAKNLFSGLETQFTVGSIEDNSCKKESIDTFIMLETLEHVDEPHASIYSIKQRLKKNGLLVGSVPSMNYDNLCEKVYGENPYHLQKFSLNDITTLLYHYFPSVKVFSVEYTLGTLVHELNTPSEFFHTSIVPAQIIKDKKEPGFIFGSLFFLAGRKSRVEEACVSFGSPNKFIGGLPKVILDRDEVEPIREAFKNGEVIIEKRWDIIQSMDEVIQNKNNRITYLENKIKNIRYKFSEDNMDGFNFDAGNQAPFLDISFSLLLFISRLYEVARSSDMKDLIFFAREGKPLKEMFDFYQSCKQEEPIVRTHYIHVSRRSTFLISLGKLNEERFYTLFRQYRRISINDFLKSLQLEEYAEALAFSLDIDSRDFDIISDDLPTDPLYTAIIGSDLFERIYEEERLTRSKAFEQYIVGILDQPLLNTLHVVDVGWKGSIQDNLFNWFKRVQGEYAAIKGYYIGLLATNNTIPCNEKRGLVFSNVDGLTQGFSIFNENRSLFELVLHADHGSAKSYQINHNGSAKSILDTYIEEQMIESKVKPITDNIFSYFEHTASIAIINDLTDEILFKLAIKKHRRMVFNPTEKEVEWLYSISHHENFGVFEESTFCSNSQQPNVVERLKFTWHVFSKRRLPQPSHWPWLTIRSNGIPFVSLIYSYFRIFQSSKKVNK